MAHILITSGDVSVMVDLNDTSTAAQMLAATPFESSVNTWGEEVYFETPLTAKVEKDSRAEVRVGDVAYWPPGKALCIFFGPTPASKGSEPRAAGPVTVIGRVVGNAKLFGKLHDGDGIRVSSQQVVAK
ncbi:MAG: hypothetical protein A2Z17_00060 [Gammaproteobacteria bacterium RBG_16_66_13]|nr:MAG: hypothetical protein A2Z17_00060 [Gammaproteobacteria bacterium RBG_16_66_13]